MDQISFWCLTTFVGAISLNTLWRVYTERERFLKDELSEADSAFAWQIVIFLVLPLLTLLDWRVTNAACQSAGGYLTDLKYALLWYQAIPTGLISNYYFVPVLFSGTIAQTVLALLLLPSLAFRPHPFLAMVIGYTAAFVPAMNLIVEPILSLAGLGSAKWMLATEYGAHRQLLPLVALHLTVAAIYILIIKSDWLRLWFSTLTRPNASDKLKETLSENGNLENTKSACYLALLYESAGLRDKSQKQLKKVRRSSADSFYASFVDAYISYRRRDYKRAGKLFLQTADADALDSNLKGALFAASACSTFAEGDMIGALNLCERALEFDNRSLVARMVKVDVFLRQGKKEQAGQELLMAMQLGLSQELENRIPIDAEKAFQAISRVEERRAAKEAIYAVSNH